MRMRVAGCLFAVALALPAAAAFAQSDDNSLTGTEVERIRDTSYNPANRVTVFLKILDERTQRIHDLLAHSRHAGRERDLHDLFAQVASICDELNDNLDDYTSRHRDVRNALPKLLAATDRWTATLRAAPEDEQYEVTRRLALAAVRDAHDSATSLAVDQQNYFKAHPEAARAEQGREDHAPHDADAPPH